MAPRLKSRCPQVHPQGRSFLDVLDSLDTISREVADAVSVDRVRDILRGPLHGVDMPIVMGIEVQGVVVIFKFLMTIAIDDICGHRVVLDGWHNFHIKLIPTTWVEVRTVPVGEEG